MRFKTIANSAGGGLGAPPTVGDRVEGLCVDWVKWGGFQVTYIFNLNPSCIGLL